MRLKMKLKISLKTVGMFAVVALIGASRPAVAWDAAGHMQIADIAWTGLSARAKQEVTAILMSGDPQFRPTSDAEADVRAAFRKAATYPDVIKGDRTTVYEPIIAEMNARFFTDAPPDPKDREAELCKTWHYYDTPLHDAGHHPIRPSNALNALTLARQQLTTLEKAPTQDRKLQCWWLYWIEHVTGDLHQPLHCVSNYKYLPEGDAGGNLFMIGDPGRPDGKGRLHGYWDAGISHAIAQDKAQGLSPNVEEVTQRWSQDQNLAPSHSDASDLKATDWIQEGAQHAESDVYTGIEPSAVPSSGYASHQILLSRKLAVLAGQRLAAVLNNALGK
jgi:hypothetical protein